jgi:hypothetical protein
MGNEESVNDGVLTKNQKKELEIVSEIQEERKVTTKTPEGKEVTRKPSPEKVRKEIDEERREEKGIDETYRRRLHKLKIGEAAQRVPEHINRLFEEIRLLDETGYLDQRTWRELTRRTGEEEYNVMVTLFQKQRKFGRKLGEFCRHLGFLPLVSKKSLVMGFAEGILDEDEDKYEVFEELSAEAWEERLERMEDSSWSREALEDVMMSVLEASVRDRFTQAPEYLIYEVANSLEKGGLHKELAEDIWSYATSEKDSLSIEEKASQQKIAEYIQKHNVEERLRARETVNDDLKRMISRNNRLPIWVLLSIPEEGDTETTLGQISDRVDEKVGERIPLSTVARVCLYLGNSKSYPDGGDRREGPPILTVSTERDNDMAGREVSLTPYGKLLRNNLDERLVELTDGPRQENYLLVFDPFEGVEEDTVQEVIEEFSV